MTFAGPTDPRGPVGVVARDEALSRSLELLLGADGVEVATYASGEALLAAPGAVELAFLFVDSHLEAGSGLRLADALRARGWTGVAVIMVEHDSKAAPRATGVVVLEKPFAAGQVMAIVSRPAAS